MQVYYSSVGAHLWTYVVTCAFCRVYAAKAEDETSRAGSGKGCVQLVGTYTVLATLAIFAVMRTCR